MKDERGWEDWEATSTRAAFERLADAVKQCRDAIVERLAELICGKCNGDMVQEGKAMKANSPDDRTIKAIVRKCAIVPQIPDGGA